MVEPGLGVDPPFLPVLGARFAAKYHLRLLSTLCLVRGIHVANEMFACPSQSYPRLPDCPVVWAMMGSHIHAKRQWT